MRLWELLFHKCNLYFIDQIGHFFRENTFTGGQSNREEAALQCRAVVLNINLGYNSDIMYECIEEGILEEILRNSREEVYAMLLAEYDEQAHIESEREIALKEGEERMAKLIQLLMAEGRTEDVNRAISDRAYRELLYKENGL